MQWMLMSILPGPMLTQPAIILIEIAIIIGAAFLLNRREADQQLQHTPTPSISPGATPEHPAANGLPSPAKSDESATVNPNSAKETCRLK